MDNNEVYSLFEDIKNDLKGINGKLENTPKATNNQSDGQSPTVDLTPIKELFESSAKEHQAQTKAMLTKFAEAEVYASNRILGLLRNLKETFVRSSEGGKDEQPQEHIHHHSFDIRSSKVFSLLVGMGIVCSLSGNIELWKSKRQYADDALKFRVIRSWGGCNANNILWLNDVFDIHRNDEAIEWIQQEADGYDKGLKTLSDSLMQEKLKVIQINGNNKK